MTNDELNVYVAAWTHRTPYRKFRDSAGEELFVITRKEWEELWQSIREHLEREEMQ